MEKPLISLSTKHFLSGIAPEAHAEGKGLFYKADGIAPVAGPGGTEAVDNGLLRAGPTETDMTGSVVLDTPVAKIKDYANASPSAFLYMLGDKGHFYKIDVAGLTVTDLRSGIPILGRQVTDGVLNTTNTVTSATAAFTAADVGAYIYGTGIPAGTTISAVGGATSITISAAATATASGVTLNFGRPSNGMEIFQAAAGPRYLYYWMKGYIGRWDLSGSFPSSSWVDTQFTIGSAYAGTQHPTHRYFNKIFYGAGLADGSSSAKCGISSITDVAGTPTHNEYVLALPSNYVVTAISDDGTYVVIAITNNINSTTEFSDTRIIFWDNATTTSWVREYTVDESFIGSMTKVGNTVIAEGTRGLYEISFSGGVKKVLSRSTFALTGSSRLAGPAILGTYNQNGIAFGMATGIGMRGPISDDLPKGAFYRPIKVSSGTPTLIETQARAGIIFVGTDTPKLYYYAFDGQVGGVSALTGVSAQTVYIPMGGKYQIKRVDFVFGEPLISGDSATLQLKSDEDATTTPGLSTAKTVSFAADGAIRRKRFNFSVNPFLADEQLSVIVNFTGGCVKIKRIEIFGTPMDL